VLVPLIIFGAPTKGGYIVIFLSVVSFLSLFVPLWGVHTQIDQLQESTLLKIHKQVQIIEKNILNNMDAELSSISAYHNRLSVLINLRKTVMETPTWPFKDTATVARAIVAVTSPLIYFILNELIRTFLFPILSGG
jgi:hypothetical protein